MSENLSKKPAKSILKTNSVEKHDAPCTSRKSKEQRFDEMNIIATLHPADKDYGHMKIEEPKTPFEGNSDTNLNPSDQLDAKLLSARLTASMNRPQVDYESSDSEPEQAETPDEKAHRIEFEKKRKIHYNEFQALQRARQLLAEEEEDDDDDDCGEEFKEKRVARETETTSTEQNITVSPKCLFKSKAKP